MNRRDFIVTCGMGMASVALGTMAGCADDDSSESQAEALARLQRQVRGYVQTGDLPAARQDLDRLSSLAFSMASYKAHTIAALSCALMFDALLEQGREADAHAISVFISNHFSATPPNERNGEQVHYKARLMVGSELMLRYAALGDEELVDEVYDTIRALMEEGELGPATFQASWGYMDDVALALYMVGRHGEAIDVVSGIPEKYPQRVAGFQDLARQAALDEDLQAALGILADHVPDAWDRFVALTYFNRVRPLIARSLIQAGRAAEAIEALEAAESTADGFSEAALLDICRKRNAYNKLSGLYEEAGDAVKANKARAKAEALPAGC